MGSYQGQEKYHLVLNICEILAQNRHHCVQHHHRPKRAKLHLSSTIVNIILVYLCMLCILQLDGTDQASLKMNNRVKQANFHDNSGMHEEFDMFDSGQDGDHNGVGFVPISCSFSMQVSSLLFGTIRFDKVP